MRQLIERSPLKEMKSHPCAAVFGRLNMLAHMCPGLHEGSSVSCCSHAVPAKLTCYWKDWGKGGGQGDFAVIIALGCQSNVSIALR